MENIFFKDILDLVPEPTMAFDLKTDTWLTWEEWPHRGIVERAEIGIRKETLRFRSYLMGKSAQDRQIIAEYTTEGLINAYRIARGAMRELSNEERDNIRPTMNAIYLAIVSVTSCVQGDLKMRYSKSIAGSEKMEANNPLANCFFDDEDDEPVKIIETSSASKGTAIDSRLAALLEKAIKVGLANNENGRYKWNGTKQLLAYLAVKASDTFSLGKSRNGSPTTNWVIFESIFGIKNLKNAKNDYMKIFTSFQPNGYDQVDKLFD